MTKLSKIAILIDRDVGLNYELEEIKKAFERIKVNVKFFYNNDNILSYQPDCVIVTSPQDAKLTPFPTYGLINSARDEYLELPRYLRNILTYDGYFTVSPRLKQMLEDVMFGARKLGSSIEWLDFYPATTEFKARVNHDKRRIIIIEKDFANSKFKTAIYGLLSHFEQMKVVTFSAHNSDKFADRFIIPKQGSEFTSILENHDIAICLESGNQQEQTITPMVIKSVASSLITIAHHTDILQEYFDDSLYYIPQDTLVDKLPNLIKSYLDEIEKTDTNVILEKTKKAHQIFLDKFAFDNLIPKFMQFHAKTLIEKGYQPNPDPEQENSLPSVTYIMRTGGKHRPFLIRALDCLVAQKYPDLRVIFVTHVKVPYLDEIINSYKTIKFKVIESIKSRRSEAIRDGMAAVETELFGLFDDDDELFPNHVRSLVKTYKYHTNLDWRGKVGMVYSGSLHVDDTEPVFERVEFHDAKLINKNEKRAIEHFKFYSSVLMSRHEWFMPNGWLARADLIDQELLVDPALDTCEDLYFELQIAQRAHFAFSVEVTAVHNFHHLGNSTNEDSKKHLPDTQRIALRNFTRVYPPDALYDTPYNIVGRVSQHDPNPIKYQDHVIGLVVNKTTFNSFYPFRHLVSQNPLSPQSSQSKWGWLSTLFFPLTLIKYIRKFRSFDQYKRQYYVAKFKHSFENEGIFVALKKSMNFFTKQDGVDSKLVAKPVLSAKKFPLRKLFFKLKIFIHGLITKIKLSENE